MGRVTRSVLPVAVRGLVVRAGAKLQVARPTYHKHTGWPDAVMILDVETTTDPTQQLLFGSYRVGEFKDGLFVCMQEGIFHADDLPARDPDGYDILVGYVRKHPSAAVNPKHRELLFTSRDEFMRTRFWRALNAEALIVGYNLAFDLTRLGIHCGEARHRMFNNGFSVVLFGQPDAPDEENDYRPRFRFRPIDSKRTIMGITRTKEAPRENRDRRVEDHGCLLDLKHLVFALTDRNLSLADAASAFGLTEGKAQADGHGVITEQYIDYNRQDVALTGHVLGAVRQEWDRHPVQLHPAAVMSPARLGKGYLQAMGVTPPSRKFHEISKSIHGAALEAYFGGRTEVRIRRTPVPVVYVDFLSMYPTVNALLGLWDMLTAKQLHACEATEEVKTFLTTITLEQCFEKATWKDLRFFAKIRPQGDIIPVRAEYGASDNLSIGVNPLTSDVELWVSGPDLVASVLLTGRVPEVLEAVRLVPEGRQEGLRPVELRGQVRIDPTTEDFFTRLIEERQIVRKRDDLSKEERDRLEKFVKVMANSASYGIFAEMNPQSSPDPVPVEVYGGDGMFPTTTRTPEEPGEFCFPPFAALTTAGARLMLALLERCVTDLGGHIAFGDTDSAAIVATSNGRNVPCYGGTEKVKGQPAIRTLTWEDVTALVERFRSLSPYNPAIVKSSILKIEDINYGPDGEQIEIEAFAISAKRYALLRRTETFIDILDAKEHGLGHLIDPMDQKAKERDEELSTHRVSGRKGRLWIRQVWEALVREALGEPLRLPEWVDRPALTRVTISNMQLWKTFAEYNEGRTYAEGIKPMNFGLSPIVASFGHAEGTDPTRFHLLGPYERDPAKWLDMRWLDKYSGKSFRIGVGLETPVEVVQVRSYRDVIDQYRVHPEPKSLDADGKPCDFQSVGLLLRRPVELGQLDYIGKESRGLEEVTLGLVHDRGEVQPTFAKPGRSFWDLVYAPALARMDVHRLAKITGLTTRQIRYIQQRKKRTSSDHEVTLKREAVRWAETITANQTASAEDKEVARRVLAVGQVHSLTTRFPRAVRKSSKRGRITGPA